jgi:multidrug efflux pump subunit AcrB
MILSDISIRRPVFAWMLMAGLIVFGAISFNRLGVSQMPDVDFPVLEVRATWDGAAPEILESELVDKIEQAVISVEGLQEVRSTIRQGAATVELEFELERDIDAALQEVQAALSQVRLPLNVDPPIIRKNSTESEPVLRIGVSGGRSLRELMEFVDTVLLDHFQVIPGVGEVSLSGFSERNLRLWVNNEKLKQFDLTILDLQRAIELEHTELAGGYIEDARREMNVRTMGEGLTPEEVGAILITQRGGQPIYDTTIHIRDVARVEDGLNDVRRIARVTGELGVSIGISKQRGSNEVKVGQAVKARMAELQAILPEGMKMQVNVDFTQFVEEAVKATEHELLLAGILTALICFLFLGTFSSGFNIVLSIPTSVIGTFTILYFSGFTLNTFTLLALALAIGIVVDDSIMVLENVVRHFQMGKDRVTAALEGAREVTFAATAASVAVIAIFLPVAFMEGVIGRFFYQFGITVTAAVALSLLEAITLTPMRLSQMMVRRERPALLERAASAVFNALGRAYRATLEVALRFRVAVVVLSAVLFAASLLLAQGLRREFVPPQDQNFVRMSIQLPVGSSLALTDARTREIETYLKSRSEVLRYFVAVGGINGVPNQSFAAVTFVDKSRRARSQQELIQEFRRDLGKLEGVRIAFQDLSTRGLTARRSQPVEFNLRGQDFDVLDEKSREIMRRLEETGLVVDLDTNYRAGMPELRIVPDREAAAARGVSMDNIGRTINAAIGGVREGKFTKDGRRYDVRLRLSPEERLGEDDVGKLTVRTSYGEIIPLAEVVKLETVKTLQTISRVNRQRAISVTANLAPNASQADALGRGGAHRRGGAAGRLRVRVRGRGPHVPGLLQQPVVRLRAGADRGLHGAGLAVQQLHPPGHRAAGGAVQHHGRTAGAARDGPVAEPVQRDRPDPAHGHRQEELHPARGIHEPEAGAGALGTRGDPVGRADPASTDPHDLRGHHVGGAAAGAGTGRRRGDAPAHGARHPGRRAGLHRLHVGGGAVRLQPVLASRAAPAPPARARAGCGAPGLLIRRRNRRAMRSRAAAGVPSAVPSPVPQPARAAGPGSCRAWPGPGEAAGTWEHARPWGRGCGCSGRPRGRPLP